SWVWPRAALCVVLALNNLASTPNCARSLHACDRDQQCGGGILRMCTPMGNLGDECHPLSHRHSKCHQPQGKRTRSCHKHKNVPFPGRRMHHTCPCLPGLGCLRSPHGRFRCLPAFRKEDVFF
uniref:Prokineticin 2 n=1 Tax=Catharus ustulatus TaxID=91951 RepID=A0A8C3U5Z2_CATUS